MKTIYLAVLLACIAGLGVVMMADSEDSEGAVTNPSNATLVDDIWYTVWDGEAIVRGPSSATLTSITIPASVTINGTSYPVTGIAGVRDFNSTGAFMDMRSLQTVTLPYTLETFTAQYDANSAGYTYSNAFYQYPPSTTASALTTVTWDIPAGESLHLESIGNNAFARNANLQPFTIPDTVTTIGIGAFSECSSFSLSAWPASLSSIGGSALSGTATALSSLPQSITSVPNSLFNACTNITQFTLHSGVTSIGSNAFSESGLTSFTIPNNVLTVGDSAFASCTSLQTLTFPSGLTEIPRLVCEGCTNLTTVNLPAGVTSIGNYAFEFCSNLHMALPSTLTTVGEFAFKGATSMELATLPSGITTIPQQAFNGAIGAHFVIPSTVTSIGNYAFGMPRSNGNVATNIEIIFDGVKGASTDTVTIGNSMFVESGQEYPANTVMTIMLYGKTYKYSNLSYVPNNCFTQSSNVTLVFNVYSIDSISARNSDTIHYFATYEGVDYNRTKSGSNWYAYATGLADDSVTSITISSQFYYYNLYCSVRGVAGSQTENGLGAFGGTSITSATIDLYSNINYLYNPNGNNFSYANTFKDCTNLTSVAIYGSGTAIPTGMFWGCTDMDIDTFPSSVKYFDNNAFRDCATLTLSNSALSVSSAGDYAFSGCESLNPTSLVLNRSVTIGTRAFEGCKSLNATVSINQVNFGTFAFAGCTGLNINSIQDSTLGEGAFSGCTAVSPSNISGTEIGDYAFENCTDLSAITIQDSSLGDCVFNLSLTSEPTVEERTLSIMFLGEIEYTTDTFASEQIESDEQAYDRIYTIADLGGNGFTPQNSGLPEGTEVSDTMTVEAMSMLQKTAQEEQHETIEDPSATATILRIVPVFIVIGIILAVVAMFYTNREGA